MKINIYFKNLYIILLLILLLFLNISILHCAQKVTDMKNFKEHLANIANSHIQRQQLKYIYFELNTKEITNVQRFSSVLEKFLLTMNIRGTVYNIEDKLLMAIVDRSSEVNTDFLKSHFGNNFLSIHIRYPG